MKTAVHVYPSLREAVLAALRIYQPLTTQKVRNKLRAWRWEGLLDFTYHPDGVTVSLLGLQEEGKVEQVDGTWRTR